MKKFILFLTVIAVFTGAAIMNAAGKPDSGSVTSDAKSLFEKKCSACHGFEKATAMKKTPENWAMVVKKMKAKAAKKDSSKQIGDEEEKTIAEYLAKEYSK